MDDTFPFNVHLHYTGHTGNVLASQIMQDIYLRNPGKKLVSNYIQQFCSHEYMTYVRSSAKEDNFTKSSQHYYYILILLKYSFFIVHDGDT